MSASFLYDTPILPAGFSFPKVYFHDYATTKRVSWVDRYSLPNFAEWLRVAQEESARFLAERDEDDV